MQKHFSRIILILRKNKMSDYEDFLKYKEQHQKRGGGNPILILIVLIPLLAMLVMPLLGGIGYASGGGEIRIFSPENNSSTSVNGNYNNVVSVNGNRNNVNFNANSNNTRGVSGEDCIVGGAFLFVLVAGLVICGALMAGINV